MNTRKVGKFEGHNPTDAFHISKQVSNSQMETGFSIQAKKLCPNKSGQGQSQPTLKHSEEENKISINNLPPHVLNDNHELPKKEDLVEKIYPLKNDILQTLKEEMQQLLIQITKDPISPQLSEVFFLSSKMKVQGANHETEQDAYRLMSPKNKTILKQISTDPEQMQQLMKRQSEMLLHYRKQAIEYELSLIYFEFDEVCINYDFYHLEFEDEKSNQRAQHEVSHDHNRDQENPRDHTAAIKKQLREPLQSLAYSRKSL